MTIQDLPIPQCAGTPFASNDDHFTPTVLLPLLVKLVRLGNIDTNITVVEYNVKLEMADCDACNIDPIVATRSTITATPRDPTSDEATDR